MPDDLSDTHTRLPRPPERLPAVWPWLLIPLAALALFFILRTLRHGP
jgi:hypothetical protein